MVSQVDRQVLAMRGLVKATVVPINPADLEIDPVRTPWAGTTEALAVTTEVLAVITEALAVTTEALAVITEALAGTTEARVRMVLGHRLRT